jgi:nucleotide-binding universal stress UspA family protein
MPTVIVGVDDSPRSEDAIALAAALAGPADAEVVAVCAFPYDDRPQAHFNLAMRPLLQERADATLERLCQPLGDDAHVRRLAVADRSPARALERVARERAADLIVVGSSHAARHSRLHPGSTAERLLHGAPCPVALAPLGFCLRPHLRIERVAVAYDDSPQAAAALRAATLVARAARAPLRAIRVFTRDLPLPPPLVSVPGYLRVTSAAEDAARDELERAVALVPDDVWAEAAFLHGDPARELATESEVADVMVIGSRGYGPLGAVLLGGVSGRVARTAACPLLIVPHGVEAPLAGLFDRATSASGRT